MTFLWLGYSWYIPEINFGYVPEGSCCERDALTCWRDGIWHALCPDTTQTPIQGIRMFATGNCSCRSPRAFALFCRMLLSLNILHLIVSLLSENPNLSCMFSPIHSANLIGRYWSTGCLWYAYSSHTLSGGTERQIASVAATDTLNCFRSSRSRRTAPVPFIQSAGKTKRSRAVKILKVYAWYMNGIWII